MLVLSRRIGEHIVINDVIQVKVIGVQRNRVQLGIIAPSDVRVDRAEIHRQKQECVTAHPPAAADPR